MYRDLKRLKNNQQFFPSSRGHAIPKFKISIFYIVETSGPCLESNPLFLSRLLPYPCSFSWPISSKSRRAYIQAQSPDRGIFLSTLSHNDDRPLRWLDTVKKEMQHKPFDTPILCIFNLYSRNNDEYAQNNTFSFDLAYLQKYMVRCYGNTRINFL